MAMADEMHAPQPGLRPVEFECPGCGSTEGPRSGCCELTARSTDLRFVEGDWGDDSILRPDPKGM